MNASSNYVSSVGLRFAANTVGLTMLALGARGLLMPLEHFKAYAIRTASPRERLIVATCARAYSVRNIALGTGILASVYYKASAVTAWMMAASTVIALGDGLATSSMLSEGRSEEEKSKGVMGGLEWLHYSAVPVLAGLMYALFQDSGKMLQMVSPGA